jgi:PAS domain S-box-containing protein
MELRVHAEQARMLYDRTGVAQATVVVNAALVAWVFWDMVPRWQSLTWVAVLDTLAVARLALARAYRRRTRVDPDPRPWSRRFTVGAALTGVAWGAAALVFFTPQSPAHQVLIAFVLGGMTAGAASSNISYSPAFVAFVAPAVSPMVVRLGAARDLVHLAMASMLALFAVAMAGLARNGSLTLRDAIRLRFKNEGLVDGLVAARQRLEGLNAELERRVADRTRELERLLALRIASEARLEATLRSVEDGVVATDNAGTVTLFNSVAERLTGWAAGEAIDRRLPDVLLLLEEGSRRPVRDLAGRVLGDARVIGPDVHLLVARDGSERHVSSTAAPMRHADGTVLGVVLALHDKTSERSAEEALRQSEQQLRAFADSMLPLAWTARPDGRVTWRNRRWYEYTGTTPARTEGAEWHAAVDPEALPEVLRRWRESVDGGTTFDMELPLRGADGRSRRFLTRVFPLKRPRGGVAQWFGTHTDVTEIVEAHETLRRSDQRKDQFIAVMSHELRNPLASIRSSLHVLEHVPVESERARQARAILTRQAQHLTRLVDDLLDVTRIARAKVQLERRPIDARAIVRRAADDHRAAFGARNVELRVETSEPAWVDADETRLSQVVGNLLQNAAKFSHEGGAVVVSTGVVGRSIEIRVRDDGIGISAEMLPRIFTPFVQAEGGLARAQGGLGLGLALVKGLVELHGGTVSAHSEGLGRGSEFVVTLPLASPAAAAEAPGPAPATRALRILHIEDNADVAGSLAEILRLEGHEPFIATTGRSGIARARELRPDVVLCDIGLPDLDGYEVARALRADEAVRSTLLVALTGYAQPDDRRRAAEAGFDAHLSKPPALDQLDALLRGRARAP